ncbi:MAG: TonB-dependent receptor [Pseudohongiellaceae bacterium]|jgi:outer membrane receptor protein involved in Fe transport
MKGYLKYLIPAVGGYLLSGGLQTVIAQEEEIVEIAVTGTRIRGLNPDSFSPVAIITQEAIAISGKISIGELLQEMPSQGSGLNRNYNNGGDGSVRMDFRNLGSGRTLILVDGKRWINSGEGANGSVDLNTIPTASVERIEILKDGASAVYGSDAIGAVINIITKDDYNGVEFQAQTGEYVDGGGLANSYQFTAGRSFEDGSFMIGASLVEIEDLHNSDRKQTAARPSFGGSSGTPQGRLAYGGVVPGCSNFTVNEGTSGASPGDFRCWTSPDDRFNYNPYNYVETPNERVNLFAKGRFNIAENTDVYLFGIYQNRESDQLLAPMPLFYGFGDFGGSEGISANNPYNPFGLEFCDLYGNSVEGKACNSTNYPDGYATGWFGRRLLEAGNRNFIQDIQTYRLEAGIETEYNGWDISAYAIIGQNKATTTTEGLLNTANIKKALAGDCTSPCVPMNVFGGQGPDSVYMGDGLWSGSGSITPEMVDYITFQAHDMGKNEMKSYGFDIVGELGALPAGPVGVAFGYEFRNEEGMFSPDAFIAAGLSSGNAASPTSGGFDVDEWYAEFAIPVLDNLDLSAAVRFSDYSTFGSTTNTKIGVTYSPIEMVSFRATFSEGFRAPSIGALYSGNNDSYPDLKDPCDVNSTNFTGAGGVQSGVCASQGVPNGFTQPNTQIRTTVGGNPDTKPEESKGYNFGIIVRPIENLTVYLDYYDIEIEDTISTIGSQLILNGCYTGSNPAYCSQLQRLPTGYFKDIRNTVYNIGKVETSGYEITATYDWDNTWGAWRAIADFAFLDEFDVTKANGAVEHYAGYVVGNSRDQFKDMKGNLQLFWNRNDISASVTAQYHEEVKGVASTVPKTLADGTKEAGDDPRKLDQTWYLDAQASYNLDSFNSIITVGIDNILDEDPPYFPDSFANDFDPSYRTWGSQFWYARVTTSF